MTKDVPATVAKDPKPAGSDLSIRTDASARRTATYWVGMIPDPPQPFHSKVIGGVTLQTIYDPWEGKDAGGMDRRGYHHGTLVSLSAEQVATLKHCIKYGVVRWKVTRGPHAHGEFHRFLTEEEIQAAKTKWALNDVQTNAYRNKMGVQNLRPDDEPVGKYIYVVKTPVRLDAIPPCVLETGIPDPE